MAARQMQLRMPAEWEKQDSVWFAWPHQKADWPGKFATIPFVFAEMIRLIAAHQRVGLVAKDEKAKSAASKTLEAAGVNLDQVTCVVAPTDRGWMRDCGPIYVRTGDAKKPLAALDFHFNGWAKYSNWRKDDTLAKHIAAHTKVPSIQPVWRAGGKLRRVVMEGGAIDVNGNGALLTTEECLLSSVQERNPGFTRGDYEQMFAAYLGINQVIWLGDGIAGDDTHGHVDDLARFTDAQTIVAVRAKDKHDVNYTKLEANWKRLKKACDAKGKPFNIAALPMPQTVAFDGERLPASYANFLITNKLVLVPIFNDPADREALNTLAELFPKREVVGVYARDLVLGLGTVHCLSQQQPAA